MRTKTPLPKVTPEERTRIVVLHELGHLVADLATGARPAQVLLRWRTIEEGGRFLPARVRSDYDPRMYEMKVRVGGTVTTFVDSGHERASYGPAACRPTVLLAGAAAELVMAPEFCAAAKADLKGYAKAQKKPWCGDRRQLIKSLRQLHLFSQGRIANSSFNAVGRYDSLGILRDQEGFKSFKLAGFRTSYVYGYVFAGEVLGDDLAAAAMAEALLIVRAVAPTLSSLADRIIAKKMGLIKGKALNDICEELRAAIVAADIPATRPIRIGA